MVVSPQFTPAKAPGVLAQPKEASLVLRHPKSGQSFTLEAVGQGVWELCDGKRTISEIAAAIAAEYDETPDVIVDDVQALVKVLMDAQLVVDPR